MSQPGGASGGYRPNYSQSPSSHGPPPPPASSTDRPYANHQPSYGPTQAASNARPSGPTHPPSGFHASGPPSSTAVLEGAKKLRKASSLEEECRSFAEYLNSLPALTQDTRLRGALPMNPRDHSLFRVCSDSILLNAFINIIRPGTVDERRLCVKSDRNTFEKNNNHAMAIAGARTLGCIITNIGPEDLSAGTPHLVLGILWQLIRLSLLSRINLESHPEIIALREEGEDVRQFVEMAPEMTLLRWFNYHLRTAGCPRRITNFSSDIRDGDLYARLLHQIAPQHCSLHPLSESDPLRRAELILQEANKVGCRQFVEAQDIVNGNEKLNLAFVAQLFHAHPQLSAHAAAHSFHEQQTREEVARAVAEQLARKEKDLRARMAQEEAHMRERLQQVEAEWRARMEAEEAALREKWRREEEARRQQMQTDQVQRMSEWEREQARKNEEWLRTQEQQNSLAQQKLTEIERERARVMEERRQLEEERARRSSAQRVPGSSHSYPTSPRATGGVAASGPSYLPKPTLDNPYNTTCPMRVPSSGGGGGGYERDSHASASSPHAAQPQMIPSHYASEMGVLGSGALSPTSGYHASAMGVMGGGGQGGGGPSSSSLYSTQGSPYGGGPGGGGGMYASSAYGGDSSSFSSYHPQGPEQGGMPPQPGSGFPGGYGASSSHHGSASHGPVGEYSSPHYQSAPYSTGGPSHYGTHGGPHGEPSSAASLAASSQYSPYSPSSGGPPPGSSAPTAASIASSSSYGTHGPSYPSSTSSYGPGSGGYPGGGGYY